MHGVIFQSPAIAGDDRTRPCYIQNQRCGERAFILKEQSQASAGALPARNTWTCGGVLPLAICQQLAYIIRCCKQWLRLLGTGEPVSHAKCRLEPFCCRASGFGSITEQITLFDTQHRVLVRCTASLAVVARNSVATRRIELQHHFKQSSPLLSDRLRHPHMKQGSVSAVSRCYQHS